MTTKKKKKKIQNTVFKCFFFFFITVLYRSGRSACRYRYSWEGGVAVQRYFAPAQQVKLDYNYCYSDILRVITEWYRRPVTLNHPLCVRHWLYYRTRVEGEQISLMEREFRRLPTCTGTVVVVLERNRNFEFYRYTQITSIGRCAFFLSFLRTMDMYVLVRNSSRQFCNADYCGTTKL